MKSLYQLHREKWDKGCGSTHCAGAKHRVLYRGNIPCDILFTGEAPGESEDTCGRPFVQGAPAGRLFEEILAEALVNWKHLTIGVTNTVACIPRDDITGTKKMTAPDLDQIQLCRPRLEEIIKIARAKLIVLVGGMAERHAPCAIEGTLMAGGAVQDDPTIRRWISITHPAAILRAKDAQRGLMKRRNVVNLTQAVEDTFG